MSPDLPPLPPRAAGLLERLEGRRATVGVIGLGYVGLPLALTLAEAGFTTLGFDVDPEKVKILSDGGSYIGHIAAERIGATVRSGRFAATGDFDRLAEPDALLICVPTPLDSGRQPDLRYVRVTIGQIRARIRPGQLVVLESTTYPGTTEELVLGPLAESGLVPGEDLFIAYSPEREDPGSAAFSTATIPRVVGGIDETSARLAAALYGQITPGTIRVSSTRVAEAAKLTENVFRAVNIALVNELKVVYDRMGIDVWEVLDAAETKPFGFMRFDPGPGWGGHCIPLDPFYLSWKASQYGSRPRFIELAGEVNVEMPRYVIDKTRQALKAKGIELSGSRVLVLGLAYKRNVADPRESPAFEILRLLLEAGAEIAYHDPHIPAAPPMRSWPDLPILTSRPLTEEELASYDAVVLVTDHAAVDYDLVRRCARTLVDTRRVFRPAGDDVVRA